MDVINNVPVFGGLDLLSNQAVANQIQSGRAAYDGNGNIVSGNYVPSFPLLANQATGQFILSGKSAYMHNGQVVNGTLVMQRTCTMDGGGNSNHMRVNGVKGEERNSVIAFSMMDRIDFEYLAHYYVGIDVYSGIGNLVTRLPAGAPGTRVTITIEQYPILLNYTNYYFSNR